ncbi:PREDICTED: extracellular calcium-sensing receptor-like [Nanorana parkeri]|uniref:extracellular calcium-sensing receptor-like n=1 Tax=Nanorana parkeri TaxID=125878 RepID=UPI000854CD8E|nr:PREDICTED: extracellular calcium-sensing receptor-like [Nanorana parkeri]
MSHFINVLSSETPQWHLDVADLEGLIRPGDVMIGIVLPFHLENELQRNTFAKRPRRSTCSNGFLFIVQEHVKYKWFSSNYFQQLQVMIFAIDEITKNSILPNITLGFQVYDSCMVIQQTLEAVLHSLTGNGMVVPNYRCLLGAPLSAVIGHPASTHSILLAQVLGLLRYPQLLNYMKKARLKLTDERELYFDENGDPPAVYDIVNLQLTPVGTIQHVKIGSYDTTADFGQIFSVNTSIIQWATSDQQVPRSVCSESCPVGFRKAPRKGQPVCCYQCVLCPNGEISNQSGSFDCIKCPWDHWPNAQKSMCLPKTTEYLSYDDPLGVTLAVTTIVSSLVPSVILRLFVQYRKSPIVKASNYNLSCLLLLSSSLCFFSSLTFIGPPQRETCLLRQSAFGMVFTLCVSCILAKTIMVVFAFMATRPGSKLKIWTSPWVSYLIILTCTLLQLTLCIIWLAVASPFPELNTTPDTRVMSFECNEGSAIAFWAMLGYLSLLAFTSFIVAFLARRLPDSFNEAQYITFSMVAFLSVWISFIPAYLSAQGKYTVAMEIFAILSSSWALLICMFFPKCFIILFRPDMNSREYLMRKGKTPSN